MKVIHVFDKFINSGVHSSAQAIYETISTFRSAWSQQVVIFSPEGQSEKICPPWFFRQDSLVGYHNLKIHAAQPGDRVVILHRAMRTPVRKIVSHLNAFRCPTIVVAHTMSASEEMNAFGICDAIVGVSKRFSTILQSCNGRTPVETIYNLSSDTNFRFSCRQRDELVFGRANSFNKIKHSDKFIAWFKGCDFGKPARLRYIGSGALLDQAKRAYVSSYGNNNIDFLGWVEGRDAVLSEMSSWDAMLYHINEPEGTSMAVIEAMGIGLPIVTSDLPGNNEILKHGESAFMTSDLHDFKNYACQVSDESVSSMLSANARRDFEKQHLISSAGIRYIDLVEQVVSKMRPLHNSSRPLSTRPRPVKEPFIKPTSSLQRCEAFLCSKSSYQGCFLQPSDGPHISLMLTCKNKEKYLQECILSICRQTYKNISISFVDDGSQDKSRSIWESMLPLLSQNGIICRHEYMKKSHGYASALGRALSVSPADSVVAVIDADDALPARACEVLSGIYSQYRDALYVWTQFLYCNKNLQPIRLGFSSAPIANLSLLESERSAEKKHCYSHWRSFRRFDGDHAIFDTPINSAIDKFMGYRLEEFGKGHFENIPLYLYRDPGAGTMTAIGDQSSNWKLIRKDAEERRKNGSCSPKGFC